MRPPNRTGVSRRWRLLLLVGSAAVLLAVVMAQLALVECQPATGSSSKADDESKKNHLVINKPPEKNDTTSNDSLMVSSQETGDVQGHEAQKEAGKRQSQAAPAAEGDDYLVGVGIADITGPAADINLMGYAKPNQDAGGIHLRQFSRSIVIEDATGSRILYISIDNGMVSQLLRSRLLAKLAKQYGARTYNESNVMISGGFFQYMLYNIPSAGFVQQTLEALLSGVLRSVERAHASTRRSKIYLSQGKLIGASINRSPYAYLQNPVEERRKYKFDTDKVMSVVKFVESGSGRAFGMASWFAVHATSMNNTNKLISSDNKGYASLLFESAYGREGALPGTPEVDFVAIFAQANEGDVSPNTRGARCIDTGLPCDPIRSTCGEPGRNEKCIAFGPGKDMFESTQIIAQRQFERASQLFEGARQVALRGPVRHVHEYVDMSAQRVPQYAAAAAYLARVSEPEARFEQATGEQGEPGAFYRTCKPALGYSFAAGTTDGPGAFDFRQADTASGRYWNLVRDFLRRPSVAQRQCHKPKPILLSTGEMSFPYEWHPRVVPTQVFGVGQLTLVALPGEFTTMAGRRVRRAVRAALAAGGQLGVATGSLPDDEQLDDDELDDELDGDTDGDADAEDEDELDFHRADDKSSGASHALGREERRAAAAGLNANWHSRSDSAAGRHLASAPDSTSSSSLAPAPERDTPTVVLVGLANIYTSYVSTLEEYCVQRYEAASTLYGPHTLQAYVNQFGRLAGRLASHKSEPPVEQPQPPDLSNSLFALKPGVLFDGAPRGRRFGDLISDVAAEPNRTLTCGQLARAQFVAANPRNDLRQESSFLYVDMYQPEAHVWLPVANDASWETKFIWERTNVLMGESKATIEWRIPTKCKSGVYRLRHLGASKSLFTQSISAYAGLSSNFKLLAPGESSLQVSQLEALLARLDANEEANSITGSGAASQRLDAPPARQSRDDNRKSPLWAPLHLLESFFGG